LTTDGSGQFFDPHRAILPIFATRDEGIAELIGTGFFVTDLGHFATAKHVFFEKDGKTPEPGLFAAHFVDCYKGMERVLRRSVTKISFSETSDVAIGALEFHVMNETREPLRNKIPKFDFAEPKVGSNVTTYAYPNSSRFFERDGSAEVVAEFLNGTISQYSATPRDRVMISWPYIEMDFEGGGRTSGGPVFGDAGRVIGIYSADGLGSSYACPAVELLSLRVPMWPTNPSGTEPSVAQLVESGHVKSVNRVQISGEDWQLFAR